MSLRALLIIVAVLGTLLGVVGNFGRHVWQQRRAIAAVKGAGGSVHFSHEFGFDDDDNGTPLAFTSTSVREVDGRKERTRISSLGKTIDYETPPGPRFLRRILGDHVFASVDAITFNFAENPDAVGPEIVAQFPELEVVWLSERQVCDDWIRECASVPRLRTLNLWGDKLGTATSQGFAQLQSAQQLEMLGCCGEWVNDDALSSVGQLQQLKFFQMLGTPHVSSAIVKQLGQLPALQSVVIIRAPGIDDTYASHLANLKELRTLWLKQTAIGDPTLDVISQMKNLEGLDVSGTKVTDAGVRGLHQLTQLRQLCLGNTDVGDAGIQSLGSLKQMKFLYLAGSKITGASVPTIASLTELESLTLCFCPLIEKDSYLPLRNLRKLRMLSIGPHVSAQELKVLEDALPECKVIAFDEQGHSFKPQDDDQSGHGAPR